MASLSAVAAQAEVLEIDPDGHVIRYDQPMIFSGDRQPPREIFAASPPTPMAVRGPSKPTPIAALLEASAQRASLSSDLLMAVARRESGLNARAISAKGALGVMQLTPGAARDLAVDPRDPAANIDGGARHLKALLARYDGDVIKALAAYNAGAGAVDRYGGLPPYKETQAYVAAILDRLAEAVAPSSLP